MPGLDPFVVSEVLLDIPLGRNTWELWELSDLKPDQQLVVAELIKYRQAGTVAEAIMVANRNGYAAETIALSRDDEARATGRVALREVVEALAVLKRTKECDQAVKQIEKVFQRRTRNDGTDDEYAPAPPD